MTHATDDMSELCVLTYGDYARTSQELVNVLSKRMVVADEVDGILGNSIVMHGSLVYDGEMYLRSLYLSFKSDGLEEGSFSKYIGSRQHCMYACVCFVITFFALYDSILVCDMNNFEWFHWYSNTGLLCFGIGR